MLWDSKRAVVAIPSLCIHLDRKAEFEPNKETHLKLILATTIIDSIMGEAVKIDEEKCAYNVHEQNYKTFLATIADDLGIEIE
jgi:aspartyl aminopeptidase